MATTAHQKQVADMRAAGLNPILSATGGSGASASGGAMPSTPDFANSALSAVRLRQEIKNLVATEKKTDAETKFTQSKTGVITPLSDLGEGLGAITTPLADSFRPIAEKIIGAAQTPAAINSAKSIIKLIYKGIHKLTGNE